MSFADRMPAYRDRVNLGLDRWLPPAATYPERFHTALRYAVMGGGKRLRPLLSYATGEWLGIAPERIDGIAVALEIVHAYSLVHYDLPAVDDDHLRRGRPSTHIAFDEATAILVGDALQAHAYYVLSSDESLQIELPQIRRQLIADLARCSGSGGMTGGQAMGMELVGDDVPTLPAIEQLYALKTGCLLQAAVAMPCRLLAVADDGQAVVADRFGRALGLAFQIVDDLLHLEKLPDATGKPRGSDPGNGKVTVASLIGPEAARQRVEVLQGEAHAALADCGAQADGLRWLCDQMLTRPAAPSRSG